jgi:hypothetical protein
MLRDFKLTNVIEPTTATLWMKQYMTFFEMYVRDSYVDTKTADEREQVIQDVFEGLIAAAKEFEAVPESF